MAYSLTITKNAEDDLAWFRKNDKHGYIKCLDFFRELAINPRKGIGKPERLKYPDGEVYSRHVNEEDRMVYSISEKDKSVYISSCRGHYE